MGQQLSCHSFYCPTVDYQLDWFSISKYSFLSTDTQFSIERGILYILPSPYIDLHISKKIQLSNIPEFVIPLHFKIFYPKPIHLTLSLSTHFLISFIFDFKNITIHLPNQTILSGKIKQNISYQILLKFTNKMYTLF